MKKNIALKKVAQNVTTLLGYYFHPKNLLRPLKVAQNLAYYFFPKIFLWAFTNYPKWRDCAQSGHAEWDGVFM